MATTLADLIEDVRGLLHGHTGQDEQVTYLTASLSSSGLSATVNSTDGLRRGIVEIDSELVWVDSVDTVSKTLTIAPFGRGYRGTTAASHSSNAKVTVNPLLPDSRVRRAINDTVNAVSGELFGVDNGTIVFESHTVGYDLPSATFPDLLDILSASWDAENGTDAWIPVRRWRYNEQADTTMFPSGKSLEIYDPIRGGSSVNVVFTSNPTPFADAAASSAAFTSTTHLPESCRDVIVYGAAARLAWGIEGGRTNQTGVSANVLGDQYGTNWRGAANNFGKQLYAFHQQRLQEERDQLLRNTQPTIHYLR